MSFELFSKHHVKLDFSEVLIILLFCGVIPRAVSYDLTVLNPQNDFFFTSSFFASLVLFVF